MHLEEPVAPFRREEVVGEGALHLQHLMVGLEEAAAAEAAALLTHSRMVLEAVEEAVVSYRSR